MSETLCLGNALVTGAASGIGRAVAVSFAREGCTRIAIGDLSEAGLHETARQIHDLAPAGVTALVRCVNVLDDAAIGTFVEEAVESLGRVDYAVNCAGIIGSGDPSHSMSVEDFDRTNAVNYRGCWLSSRAEIRAMRVQEPLPTHDGRPGARGAIVNIASQLGIVGRPDSRKLILFYIPERGQRYGSKLNTDASATYIAAYCASKAAVISMTRCDAIDCSKDNIRVNCVCPGYIDTPMTHTNIESGSSKHYIDIAPMKRPGTAQEVADCVLFLCSSKASFVQGSAMVVDGGYTIN